MTTPADPDTAPAEPMLPESECWALLSSVRLARVALVRTDDYPDIRPINHLVWDGAIYLRTAPDAKVRTIAAHPRVAVEADGEDADGRWSVVVRGEAEQVTSEAEIRRAGVSDLVSWTPTTKHYVLKITPVAVTGRRFPLDAHGAGTPYAVPLTDEARRAPHARADRPFPIPHHAPPSQHPRGEQWS